MTRYDNQSLIPPEALPRGFQFAAVKAGIKPSGKADFAVAVADRGTSAAAMFTANRVQAAPIAMGRRHLERSHGRVRVVAVNAGNANCATGAVGMTACEQVCKAAAKTFGCEGHEVFPSSTGIIGVPLPCGKTGGGAAGGEERRWRRMLEGVLAIRTGDSHDGHAGEGGARALRCGW